MLFYAVLENTAIKTMISYIAIPNQLLAIFALFKAASHTKCVLTQHRLSLTIIRFKKPCNFSLSSPVNFHYPLPILR